MTVKVSACFIGWLILLSTLAVPLAADDKKGDDGWIDIFDGKTLKGWKATEKPENWKVEDGAIVGRGDRSHLFYIEREFTDLEFKAEVKINKGGNSGMFFRTQFGGGWPKNGYGPGEWLVLSRIVGSHGACGREFQRMVAKGDFNGVAGRQLKHRAARFCGAAAILRAAILMNGVELSDHLVVVRALEEL